MCYEPFYGTFVAFYLKDWLCSLLAEIWICDRIQNMNDCILTMTLST